MITTLAYLTARASQLPSDESSRLTRISASGGDRFVVSFADGSSEELIWSLPLVPAAYQGGLTTLEVQCAMESATAGSVALSAYVESDATTTVDVASFDAENATTSAVPATAGEVFTVSIDLTNDDSLTVGSSVRIKLVRAATGDTATGALYVLGAIWSETVSSIVLDADNLVLGNNTTGTFVTNSGYIGLNGSDGLYFITNAASGSGIARFQLYNNSANVPLAGQFGWANIGVSAPDTGLIRDSAGVIKVTDGSTGLGSLVADSLTVNTNGFLGGWISNPNYTALYLNGQQDIEGTNYNIVSNPSDMDLYINRPSGNVIRIRENNAYDQVRFYQGGHVWLHSNLTVNGESTDDQVQLIVRGSVGQTADFFQILDSDDNELFSHNATSGDSAFAHRILGYGGGFGTMGLELGSDGAYPYIKPVGGAGSGNWHLRDTNVLQLRGSSYTGPNASTLSQLWFVEENTAAGVFLAPAFENAIPTLTVNQTTYGVGSSNGRIRILYPIITRNSAPANGDLSANECSIWFDSTNGTSNVMYKGKSANGTVVSGQLSGSGNPFDQDLNTTNDVEFDALTVNSIFIDETLTVPDSTNFYVGANVPIFLNGDVGTAGQVMKSQGEGQSPIWDDPNPFDQDLNTTDSVGFVDLAVEIAAVDTLAISDETVFGSSTDMEASSKTYWTATGSSNLSLTLSDASVEPGRMVVIKNQSTGRLTVYSDSGGGQIYRKTDLVATIELDPGGSLILIATSTGAGYWNVVSIMGERDPYQNRPMYNIGTTGGTISVNYMDSRQQRVQLNSTLSGINIVNDVSCTAPLTLIILNPDGHTINLDASTNINWPGGTTPTPAAGTHIVTILYDSATGAYYGNISESFS